MTYEVSGKQITQVLLLKALNRLGDLLRERKTRVDLVCCGGVVSVLYHRSRHMTHDVDVLFPKVLKHTKLLKSLIDQKERFSVINEDYRSMWDADLASPIFSKRNIFAPKEFMFFL